MKKMLLMLSAFVCLTSATPALIAADYCNPNPCCDVNPCCDPCFDPCCDTASNFYVGVLGGANWIQNSKRRFGHKAKFETGYAVGGVVGYKFWKGLRAEAEITYRENSLKSFNLREVDGVSLLSSERIKGKFRSTSYMVNALYDVTIPCWPIMPYVGVGIGYASQRFSVRHFDTALLPVVAPASVASSADHRHRNKGNGFAWQVIAGIGYNFNSMFDIDLDYRFNQGEYKDLYNHTLSVVAKYHF